MWLYLILQVIIILLYMFDKTQPKQNGFILNKQQSYIFEIIELVTLTGLIVYSLYRGTYVITLTFSLAFIEHIRQIFMCYRQDGGYKDILTLLQFLLLLVYSIYNKIEWVKPWALLGMSFHMISLRYNKGLSDKVCV